MAKLSVKKDSKDKRKNLKIEQVVKENKGEYLRRLVKKYSGENAELPKVF